MPSLLVIDDERSIRKVLRDIFTAEGFTIEEAVDGFEALNLLKNNDYSAVLCDIKMPKIDGLEFLEKALQSKPNLQVVILSGNNSVDMAVEAVKKGAFDYVSKPPDLNVLLKAVKDAVAKAATLDGGGEVNLIQSTKNTINSKSHVIMLGNSEPMQYLKSTIAKVAPTDARVLITGENGSGKELVAKSIHAQSIRSHAPLIEVNCAAIPNELIESELFGHEKGSFTSAIKQRIGKFELANGGTLFLDEIGDMGLSAQAKVLRALQEGKITRVGGEKEIDVNVRVLAATNKNLLEEVNLKNFRLDLYHRLSVIVIKVPTLNERGADIPELVNHYLEAICLEYKVPIKTIAADAIQELQLHNWTGNIRELSNVMARLIILCGSHITLNDVQQLVTKA
jgi:two-component system, NtrC family, nitrogen regulation response regulator NtrX